MTEMRNVLFGFGELSNVEIRHVEQMCLQDLRLLGCALIEQLAGQCVARLERDFCSHFPAKAKRIRNMQYKCEYVLGYEVVSRNPSAWMCSYITFTWGISDE